LCPICGERVVSFSQAEPEADPEPCGMCRRAAPVYSRAIAYGAFEDAVRDTIHLLKYARVLRRAGAASVFAATAACALKAGPNADRIGMETEVERAA
jgi:predicted amidophosphoribosyltransferase